MICAVKKIPFILFLLCTVLYAQGAQKLTYSIIKELDVEPVSEKNYCGEECGFQLKIPYVKADSVMAAIPDLPSGVSFVSLRRSDYADETSGTKIELWLTFPDAGTYRLRFLRVTINGKFYNIPFKPITIYENPRNMFTQLVVEFDNGTELVRQKNTRQNAKAVFSSPAGTPLYFTVYLQYAVQLVSFYWNIPKNALFTELERYEITKGMLRNSEFSEEKIPVARFEWQPLVTGSAALPEISLTATSYNGSRVELSMPDSYVQIVPPVADENDFSGEETFFAYAFTKLPEKSAVSVKQAVSQDDCRTIATLREKERNELPFGEARKERIAFERQCGIRNAENEPTYFVRNTLICLTIIFAVFLGMAVMIKKIPAIIIISTLGISCFVMMIISAVRLSSDSGIFTGGGIRAVPEETVDAVKSIESGRLVKIEQRAGGWVYVRVGTSGGWILEDTVISIR